MAPDPLALSPAGIFLVPDGALGRLRQPPVDRGGAPHQREILCVRPILAVRSGRAGAAVGTFDADQVPVAHVGRHPRIHAHPGVPSHPDRDEGDRTVARDVQLRQRTGKIGTAVGNRRSRRGVRSGVVHHHAPDVLEVSMPAGAPAGILDEIDALGTEHIGEPDRVTGPWSGHWHWESFRSQQTIFTIETTLGHRHRG